MGPEKHPCFGSWKHREGKSVKRRWKLEAQGKAVKRRWKVEAQGEAVKRR